VGVIFSYHGNIALRSDLYLLLTHVTMTATFQ